MLTSETLHFYFLHLLLERFVLATGKNYTHRIYIGKGIYADLTLIFQNGSFSGLKCRMLFMIALLNLNWFVNKSIASIKK